MYGTNQELINLIAFNTFLEILRGDTLKNTRIREALKEKKDDLKLINDIKAS